MLVLEGDPIGGAHALHLYKVQHSAASIKLPAASSVKTPIFLRLNGPFYRPWIDEFAVRSFIDTAGEDSNISLTFWLEAPKREFTNPDDSLVYSPLNHRPGPVISGTEFSAVSGTPTYQTFAGETVSGNWVQLGGKVEGTWTQEITITVQTWVSAFGLNISDNPFAVEEDYRPPEQGDLFTDLTARS